MLQFPIATDEDRLPIEFPKPLVTFKTEFPVLDMLQFLRPPNMTLLHVRQHTTPTHWHISFKYPPPIELKYELLANAELIWFWCPPTIEPKFAYSFFMLYPPARVLQMLLVIVLAPQQLPTLPFAQVWNGCEVVVCPEQADVPLVPEVPELPEAPAAPLLPEVPLAPVPPALPEVPLVPLVDAAPLAPVLPDVPLVDAAPEEPAVPAVPLVPVLPLVPLLPAVPLLPDVPELPLVPEVPELPGNPVPP